MLVRTTTGLSYGGTALQAMMTLLCKSTESIKRALLMLEVREAIAQYAHCQVKAKMEVVKQKLESVQNETDMRSKENKLEAANTACYELLILFNDKNFYLLQKPLAFAPFFVSFVSIYLVVIKAHYLITTSSQHKPDVTKLLKMLKEVIRKYQNATAKARKDYVHMEVLYFDEEVYCIKDELTNYEVYLQKNYKFRTHIAKEIQEWYKDKLEKTYSNYFNASLQLVDRILESL